VQAEHRPWLARRHPAAVASTYQSPGARTRIETLISLGRKPELVPEQALMDGINAGRTEWDEKAQAFKKTPDHNWASPRRG
jgi:hypothetical protein